MSTGALQSNAGKRLVKSRGIYIRDSGLTHALLNIGPREDLLGHPIAGGSWEGFWIENLISTAPRGTEASFYRSSAGPEIDLVLKLPDGALWAIDVKRTTSPKVSHEFHIASDDLGATDRFFALCGDTELPAGDGACAVPLLAALKHLTAA